MKNTSINKKLIKPFAATLTTITVATLTLAALTLTGCSCVRNSTSHVTNTVTNILSSVIGPDEEYIAAVNSEATVLIEDYLRENYSDYTIGAVSSLNAYNRTNSFDETESPIAGVDVVINGIKYEFYADTETDIVYSTMQAEQIKQFYWDDLTGDSSNEISFLMTIPFLNNEVCSMSRSSGSSTPHEIITHIGQAYPVTASVDEIYEDYLTKISGKNAYIDCTYCSDEYEFFTPESLSRFKDNHPEITALYLTNTSQGDIAIIRNNNTATAPYSLTATTGYKALGIKEEYRLEWYDTLTYEYTCHTHCIVDGVTGVNYVSKIIRMENDDFSLIEEKSFDVPIEVMGNKIYTHYAEIEYPAYIFFSEDPGYTSASVTASGSSDSDKYSILQYPCGYYSMIDDSYYTVTTHDGYKITRSETIVLCQ